MPNLDEMLRRAVALHQAGDFAGADPLYRQVVAENPHHADAWHLLGLLVHQQGSHTTAVVYLRMAIDLDPGQALFHHHLGSVYRALGDRVQAVAAFQAAIRLRSDNPESHNNLAVVLLDLGRNTEAETHCRRALELQPNYADACNNLGVALQQARKFASAAEAFSRAIALRPDYFQARRNLATVLMEIQRPADAAEHFERLAKLAPRDPELRCQAGVAWYAARRFAAAKAAYTAALALRPDLATAHYGLAAVLEDEGQLTEARSCYEQALRHRPQHASTHNNLGNVHKHLNRLDLAVDCYRRALEIDPRHFSALVNLSSALHEQGHQAESLRMYERAQSVREMPALVVRSRLMSPLIPASLEEATQEYGRLDRNLDELIATGMQLKNPAADVGMTPFYWAYLGCDVRPLLEKLSRFYRQAAPSLSFVAPHCQRARRDASRRRLRIGFLSRYFYDHPVGMHYSKLLASLPADRFEIVLIRQPGRIDVTAKEIEHCAHRIIPLGQDLAEVQQVVAQAELDVLLFAEIGMDPLTYYLAYSRLAPVQCVLPGHPMTSGVSTLDYFMSNRLLEPAGGAAHYTERLFQFNALPTLFVPPELVHRHSRTHFGLPESAPLYFCAQTLTKIHPDFDVLAARLLQADPEARLVLFAGNQQHWTVALRERLSRQLGPAIDRVMILPRQNLANFRAVLALADVVLDTVHFNGGTTTLEALAVGAPIVTLPGPFMRGRQTLACYLTMELMDCVAADEEDYVRIALRLAHDRPFRERVDREIMDRRHRLCDGEQLVSELAAFLQHATEQAIP